MKHVKIIVSGRVQGVAYRQATKRKALELHICGTVKNLVNGNVEIIAQSSSAQIDQLINWCHSGPPAASVANVEVFPLSTASAEFESFDIIS